MKGNRILPDADGWLRGELKPGDYGRAIPPESNRKGRREWWVLRTPLGHSGTLNPETHTVTEHADGSITVHPSIVIRDEGAEVYHGWLERGVWRGA